MGYFASITTKIKVKMIAITLVAKASNLSIIKGNATINISIKAANAVAFSLERDSPAAWPKS